LNISHVNIQRTNYEMIHCDRPLARNKPLAILLKAMGLPHGQVRELALCPPNPVTHCRRPVQRRRAGGTFPPWQDTPGFSGTEEALRDALSREAVVNSAHAAEVVEGVCGWPMGRSTVIRWMRALGRRFRKAMAIPAKADPAAQVGFLTVNDHAKAIDHFIREVNAGFQAREMNALITRHFQQFQDSHFAVA
jgi:hypothetical protein